MNIINLPLKKQQYNYNFLFVFILVKRAMCGLCMCVTLFVYVSVYVKEILCCIFTRKRGWSATDLANEILIRKYRKEKP